MLVLRNYLQKSSQKAMPINAETRTDIDFITDADALLLAESDPTAISLTFLFWCDLIRPDLQKQLEQEIATVDEEFIDAVRQSLPILNAVIESSKVNGCFRELKSIWETCEQTLQVAWAD